MQPRTDLGVDGVEVDYLSTAACLHMRQRSLHRPPGRPYRGVKRLGQHLIGLIFKPDVGRRREGVVHQDIEPTEFIHGSLNGRLDVFLTGNISLHKEGPAPQRFQLLRNSCTTLFVQLCNYHRSARLGEAQRDTSTYTAARTSNKRHTLL